MRLKKVLKAAATVGMAVSMLAGTSPAGAAGPNLTYNGGAIDPTPAIYLVYWGTQWTTVGDPARMVPYEQAFFNGLYGSGDNWTTPTQQYCSGAAIGATSCGSGTTHVGVPSGSLIKGIWYDNALPSPPAPTQTLFAQEAVAAAAHFGNNTAAKNASVEYIIHTPDGFNDPEFGAVYCAWHSSTSSSYGPIAYTNMPYIPNAQLGTCGANSVNSGNNGNLDGVSIVGGHEFLEVITDPFPNSGWLDSGGQENADKCAWISSGPGAMHNLSLSTGTFAVQTTWSNSAGGCA